MNININLNEMQAHDGRLPVRIRAVPEGTVVPTKNVLLTIENTDPQCFWLTSYLEVRRTTARVLLRILLLVDISVTHKPRI